MVKISTKALLDYDKEVESRSSKAGFLNLGKKPGEWDLRIIPPKTQIGPGLYFYEEQGYWIKGKRYVSPATKGLPCPIQEEIKRMKDQGVDLTVLSDWKAYTRRSEYYFIALVINADFGEDGSPENIEIEGDNAMIVVTSYKLIKQINREFASRFHKNGTDAGLADREKGWNLVVSVKKGANNNTEFNVQAWPEPTEMPEEYYEEENIPDIVEIVNSKIASDDILINAIQNYVYGDDEVPLIESGSSDTDAEVEDEFEEKPKKKTTPVKKPGTKTTTGKGKSIPAPEKKKVPVKGDKSTHKRGPSRDPLKDLENL